MMLAVAVAAAISTAVAVAVVDSSVAFASVLRLLAIFASLLEEQQGQQRSQAWQAQV